MTPGIVVALHTFGSKLEFNPHIHMLVTMGEVTPDGKWKTYEHKKKEAREKLLKNMGPTETRSISKSKRENVDFICRGCKETEVIPREVVEQFDALDGGDPLDPLQGFRVNDVRGRWCRSITKVSMASSMITENYKNNGYTLSPKGVKA